MYEQINLFDISDQETEKQEESTLTNRQKALYNLIYFNSIAAHRKTTQREIVEKLEKYGYQWTESENTSDHCSAIWNDVAALNLSFEKDNVIITKNYIYWIGSKRETEAFLRKLWKDLAPRLHRYWFYVKKVGRDGQGNLFDELNDSTIAFREAFNKYDVEMQRTIEENKVTDKELNKEN